MASKITLYSDEKMIADIKKFAKEHNTSVSKLVNEFFSSILQQKQESDKEGITDFLCGILKDSMLNEKDYKRYLQKKYL